MKVRLNGAIWSIWRAWITRTIFRDLKYRHNRLSELVRLGLEFASDQSFAIEDYVIGKMARCFGTSEEQAFINGTGENQPTGILHATDGAETGVTAESDSAISYDEIIKLYLSVDKKYRKHGTWLMNDETALALRTLKDSAGNYLWKEVMKRFSQNLCRLLIPCRLSERGRK